MAEPLKIVCAWCHRERRVDGSWTRVKLVEPIQVDQVSHGICPICAVAFRVEIAGFLKVCTPVVA